MPFAKLSEINEFTVKAISKPVYKMWDGTKMLTYETYQQGAQKKYPVETDKGIIDFSATNLGNLLLLVGETNNFTSTDLIGKHFLTKTNGKTGMDVRYFFKYEPKAETATYRDYPVIDDNDIPDFAR